ncbi:MFS transporter [Actinomycetospora termitidis]|uniref:MFS transporter n=1 Tax=Actinomycetospora termitidis TaxID=3053470 RepID=A0ABT7M4M9_9PSEU|nr:MFS transporter [Actinomycetospora sp. Odt1-22]MDL5155626.1 MFS transporter [Actinomycetospora sp. Odt1-22]
MSSQTLTSPPGEPVEGPPAPPVHRPLVLALTCTGVLLVGIDMTAVNVALPAIGREFGTGASGLSWTIDAYTLVLAATLMAGSSAADRFGRKRVFCLGLTVFAVASALCALAPGLGWLVAFRALQAVGGSMLNPVAMAILSSIYPGRTERARALGVWGGVTGLSLAVGPIVGGALVDSPLGWRWIFLINVPIGLLGMALTRRFVPESRADRPRRFDPVGQVLIAVALTALTFGVIEGPHLGWASPAVVCVFVLAVLAVAVFVAYEQRRREPLLDLRFFRSVPFSGANVVAMVGFASLGSFLYLSSIYLEQARHFSPLETGLILVPLAAVSVVWGPVSGHVLARWGARPCLVVGGVSYVVAGLLLSTVTTTTPIWLLLLAAAAMGLGNSSISGTVTNAAVAGMPAAQASVAAGVAATTRQIGQTVGVAVAGVTIAHVALDQVEQLAASTHVGWWLIAAYGVAIVVLGVVSTTRWARATARRATSGSA